MHIVFDGRAMAWTGIGRYTRNLLMQYSQMASGHQFTVLIPNSFEKEVREQQEHFSDNFTYKFIESSYYSWREQLIFWRQLERLQADLFHFPHFNVPIFFRKPYVATIHDATRFIFPSQKRSSAWEQLAYEYVFSQTLRHAKAVIAVTQHTAEEIVSLPLPSVRKLAVISEGVSGSFRQHISDSMRKEVRNFLSFSQPYLLYVGVWMAHKNLRRLLAAFAQVHQEFPDIHLVITGKAVPGHVDIRPYVRELGIEDVVHFVGFVPHHLLPALYGESLSFVFPSLYEGFGLPPLEAAACGAPVVASNVSSIPEVMGDTVEYINPEVTESIAFGLKKIITSEQLRDGLAQKGKERSEMFSWEDCAREHIALYEQIV